MMTDFAMTTWNEFIWFAVPAFILSSASAFISLSATDSQGVSSVAYCCRRKISIVLAISAILALGGFISGLWLTLERPPLRTMGETRLWYSFFAMVAGLFTYLKWRYRWILSYSTILASVFIALNLFKPEIHDQTLMPALQSPWFIPHVTVYMFSYSFLGCAFILGIVRMFKEDNKIAIASDTLVYIGIAFLTFGMLSGALWAKDAWGDYWSWDPKETWAVITWLAYMGYIHLRIFNRNSRYLCCILLIFAFVALQMCWWGINYLPSAQDSIHIYNR